MTLTKNLEHECVNTIRTLSMDAVEAANSGHPGTPMAMAPVGYVLFNEFLRFDPTDPLYYNRDRFVLSMGHASMLLYSLLHLSGVRAVTEDYELTEEPAVSLDDIKNFRQLGSRCPGHPEYRLTTGVETTTGPLGQGIAASVGMAMSQKWLAATYNKPGYELFDFDTYALCGDGCMMEGVSSEAASLAGHLGLSNLCWIYDDNRITIEGKTDLAFSEDVANRFASYGWQVLVVQDVNDLDGLRAAFRRFKAETSRPTLIKVTSEIGYGAPEKQGCHTSHGAPLGDAEVRGAKRAYQWPEDAKFRVPDEVREHFRNGIGLRGARASKSWSKLLDEYAREYPAQMGQIQQIQRRELPDGWEKDLPRFAPDGPQLAGREASGLALTALGKNYPWLLGGSADLAPSTKATLDFPEAGDLSRKQPGGRNVHFGVCELCMGSVLNGMSACKLRPFGSGFLVFSDFSRPALRLSALMELPVVYVFTHDSIGVGEDGPTHQPVEQLAALRAIPGLLVLRPGDPNEVVECYRIIAKEKKRPACLVLSRQKMLTLDRSKYAAAEGAQRGAYVLGKADPKRPLDLILMASGTEVAPAAAAYEALTQESLNVQLVSIVSWELFEEQPKTYRDEILPRGVVNRLAVEAAAPFGWERYVGLEGEILAVRSFGASGKARDLEKKFGLTPEDVLNAARRVATRPREIPA